MALELLVMGRVHEKIRPEKMHSVPVNFKKVQAKKTLEISIKIKILCSENGKYRTMNIFGWPLK